MLVGYLLREIFVIALGGNNSDLDLLQGKDDSDMRPNDEQFGFGGFDLYKRRDTLKGAEQLFEGLLMIKEASNLESEFGVKVR